MRPALSSSFVAALVALSFASTACSSDSKDDSDSSSATSGENVRVEVFSWWTAPGEAEALQALIDLHKERFPKERVYNAATDPKVTSGGTMAKAVLKERLDAGDPPDAFQTNAYELSTFDTSSLEPLDSLFEEEGLTKNVAPEVLHDVTVDGHIVGVPVNVHRSNGLFYNKVVFADNGLEPPNTMDEFLADCATLKAAGVTPLAISTSQAWIMEKVFQAFALGSLGPDGYVKYFVDKTPVDMADFRPIADALDLVLTEYIDVDAASADDYGWTQAADALLAGKAAMFIHGDWAKGYLMQLGATPNVDFGVVRSPGSEDAFIYGMDVFSVPAGAKHKAEANDFVKTIASSEGQVRFNEFKGSSPVRLNVDTSDMDELAQSIYADFKNSDHRIAEVGLPAAWDDAIVLLAKDHDKDAWLQTLVDNPLAP